MRLHWLWRVLAVQYAVTAVAALLGSGEGRAMQELQRGLHVPESAWPAWEDPCTRWQGVVCVADHVDAITLPAPDPGATNQSFDAALDALRALPFLRALNASGFPLQRAIPTWLPTSLQTLDLSSCALTGAIPPTIATLSTLNLLSLSHNTLTGPIPASLFNATSLTQVDLSHNNLTGWLPNQLGNLTYLDVSHNLLSGAIPTTLSTLNSLTFLSLATNNLSGPFPGDITACTALATLNVRENRLAGVIPETIGGLKNLVSLDLSSNRITGLLPLGLTTSPLLQTMDVSHNYLYGPILDNLVNIQSLNLSFNFFNGSKPMRLIPGAVVRKNCLVDSPGQHTFRTCSKFYYKLGLVFGAPASPPTYPTLVQPPEGSIESPKSRHLVPILAGVLGGVGLIFLVASLVFCVHFICGRAKQRGSGRTTSVGSVRGGSARATAPASVPTGRMGEVFSYAQLQQATKNFSLGNLISTGHSGDLYKGLLESGAMVAVKRIDLTKVRMETYLQELEVLGRASHTRLVLLLGHCLERDDEKFLVYKYTPNGDLASALHKKGSPGPCEDVLQSLDWITRLKIAIGVAEALSYLHSECSPPIVHRDVKASSILLDDKFEVRLGSLSDARVQDGDPHPSRITRLLGLSQSSDQGDAGAAVSTSSDVYNFGKVLLELVSGKLGISGAGTDPRNEAWLEWALPLISVHDKESLPKLVDPSLIVDEDLLEEVWAMAIIARACLHSKPHKRPSMRHVLKALENPHKVVREENFGESLAVRTSSHSSWNEALFGSWRHNHNNNNMSVFGSLREDAIHGSLPVAKASGTVASSSAPPFPGHARRGSSDIVPEPIDEEELPQ